MAIQCPLTTSPHGSPGPASFRGRCADLLVSRTRAQQLRHRDLGGCAERPAGSFLPVTCSTPLVTGETRAKNTVGNFFRWVSLARPIFQDGPGAWEASFHRPASISTAAPKLSRASREPDNPIVIQPTAGSYEVIVSRKRNRDQELAVLPFEIVREE
jgi:hypothetical protein